MKLFWLAFAAVFVSGCSGESEADIEVSIKAASEWLLEVNIQAISDEVIVKDVVINRGNCALPPENIESLSRTRKLKFGQSFRVFTYYCRIHDIKEIRVQTGEGAFDFIFN